MLGENYEFEALRYEIFAIQWPSRGSSG